MKFAGARRSRSEAGWLGDLPPSVHGKGSSFGLGPDDIGAVLGGESIAQRRRLDPDLGVRGQLETEGLLE